MVVHSSDRNASSLAAALAREFPDFVFVLDDGDGSRVAKIIANAPCSLAASIARAAAVLRQVGKPALLPQSPFSKTWTHVFARNENGKQ